jgi:hypothetical protein
MRLLGADPRVGIVGDRDAHPVSGQLAGQRPPVPGAHLRAWPEGLGQPLGRACEFLVDRVALKLRGAGEDLFARLGNASARRVS